LIRKILGTLGIEPRPDWALYYATLPAN